MSTKKPRGNWVMHVWSNGHANAWNADLDALYERIYGPRPAGSPHVRECTTAELAEIEAEQARFGRPF